MRTGVPTLLNRFQMLVEQGVGNGATANSLRLLFKSLGKSFLKFVRIGDVSTQIIFQHNSTTRPHVY